MKAKTNKYSNTNTDNSNVSTSLLHPSTEDNNGLENVLILQGGGSLGAFGCGVFKALATNNIKIDVVAGTSIGGINAAVIAGMYKLSERFVDLDKVVLTSPSSLPKFVEDMMLSSGQYYDLSASSGEQRNHPSSTMNADERSIKMKQLKSFYSSAAFGNDKMFIPRWRKENSLTDPEYFTPQKWTYMYDHTPLIKL
jgi:NTE family protein